MNFGDIKGYAGTVIRVFIFPRWAIETVMEGKNYLLFLDDILFPEEIVSDWYAESVSREMARNALKDPTIYANFYLYFEVFYRGEKIEKLVASI